MSWIICRGELGGVWWMVQVDYLCLLRRSCLRSCRPMQLAALSWSYFFRYLILSLLSCLIHNTHHLSPPSISHILRDNTQQPRALTTFRKETEDGQEMELHQFEVAALMNLVATDTMVEEAVALIPSLSRFPESAVDEILDLIRSTMIRIVSYGS